MPANRKRVREPIEQEDMSIRDMVSADLCWDRKTVLKAVEKNGFAFAFASPDLRTDREVAMIAMKTWPEALQYACDQLQDDPALLRVQKESMLRLEPRYKLHFYLLDRHKDLKRANLQAAVDLWLIKNGLAHWIDANVYKF